MPIVLAALVAIGLMLVISGHRRDHTARLIIGWCALAVVMLFWPLAFAAPAQTPLVALELIEPLLEPLAFIGCVAVIGGILFAIERWWTRRKSSRVTAAPRSPVRD